MKISGQIVDVLAEAIFPGELEIADGRVAKVTRLHAAPDQVILPGFVDAHVHIESSMLAPSEFARLAVVHGTVGTVSDPHEIGNVLGVEGVRWMIENGKTVPFKFNFGAPSCVPATTFETAGAAITAAEVDELLSLPEIRYLSEMMNFPGVLFGDTEVHAKLQSAKKRGKVIDGHAPGLRGEDAARYASFGITTDHECFTADEALDKIRAGMSIIIREGSAAKNFEALIGLLREFPERIMFCSDDKHPNDLVAGHINQLVKRALAGGHELFSVLRAASLNPVKHYGLPIGLLQEGDPADFIVMDSLRTLNVLATYIDGKKVAEHGKSLIDRQPISLINNFSCANISPGELALPAGKSSIRVIEALPGQLITKEQTMKARIMNGCAVSDPEHDLLKLVVVNRYKAAPPAIAFATGFGLKRGALASSVAHDSHNIVAIGAGDDEIADAINLVIENDGGVSLSCNGTRSVVPLPIAGLMSADDGYKVGNAYEELDLLSKKLGCSLPSPFMTLSFLALLVIPDLKLSDLGLFDGRTFQFVDLFVER
ncbi:MAG: adenine deaminase [Bdellovibrionota bacterium]